MTAPELHCQLFSMKFAKPRTLLENSYPDLDEPQPILLRKLVQEVVNPKEQSDMSTYINSTIEFLKNRKNRK